MGDFMTKPVTEKNATDGNNEKVTYGACSMQGWRITNEDAHLHLLSLTKFRKDGKEDPNMLFAVFDGHGGQEVAIFCEKYMPEMLVNNKHYLQGKYEKALEDTFVEIDYRLISDEGAKLLKQITIDIKKKKTGDGTLDKQEIDELKQTPFGAGCTSCVCLVTPTHVYCANAGDSRAILATKEGKVIELSHDHKPENEGESKRVYDNNGFVQDGRVNGVIAVSRALGDWEYKTPPTKKEYIKSEEAKNF